MDLSVQDLNAQQRDALIELINIAFGRAGSALAQITGHRVALNVPNISVTKLEGLFKVLHEYLPKEVATVQQIFSGTMAGSALLIVDLPGAARLKELLTDEPVLENRIDGSAQEVLTEIGNIVLNAMLGTFGNLLKTRIGFAVPRLHLDSLEGVLRSIIVNQEVELRYALVVHTVMQLRESEITGYAVMVLGVASLDKFLQAVDLWATSLEDPNA